jgi:hypothetical protein
MHVRQDSPGRLLRDVAGPAELRESDTARPDGPPAAGALSRQLTGGSTTTQGRSSQAEQRPALLRAVHIHASAARSAPCGGAINVAPRARCGVTVRRRQRHTRLRLAQPTYFGCFASGDDVRSGFDTAPGPN